MRKSTTRGPKIAASLLPLVGAADIPHWAYAVTMAGADKIHLDIHEHNPPDVTFSPAQVRAIGIEAGRANSHVPIEAHFVMDTPTEITLADYMAAGIKFVIIHWEAFTDKGILASRLRFIQSRGGQAILAVCTGTDVAVLHAWLRGSGVTLDGISFCATLPGKGGGSFNREVLAQVRGIRRYGFHGTIQVDGGIEPRSTATLATDAGAECLVVGSALFGGAVGRSIARLSAKIRDIRGHRAGLKSRSRLPQHSPTQRCLKCNWVTGGLAEVAKCPECEAEVQFTHPTRLEFLDHLEDRAGLWRYSGLLPISPISITTAGEGATPIVYDAHLSERLRIKLYFKLETTNPTGTFKDREGSFVVSRARMASKDNLVFQSTGNTAVALSYYAHLGGLCSWGFVPARNAYKLIGPQLGSCNHLILVEGEPHEVKEAATRFASAHGFPKVSPFHHRSEANVTIGYEVGEKILRGELPNFDVIAQTIAAGMGPIGIVHGMDRLVNWSAGRITMPRMLGVEISEFAPLHSAWVEGREPGPEAETPTYGLDGPYEPTLHTTNARPYYPHLRAALRASAGDLVRVEPWQAQQVEDELRAALARHGASLTQTDNSAFIGYSGLKAMVAQGWIEPGSTVLLIITGKGHHPEHTIIRPTAIVTPGFDPVELRNMVAARDEVVAVA